MLAKHCGADYTGIGTQLSQKNGGIWLGLIKNERL